MARPALLPVMMMMMVASVLGAAAATSTSRVALEPDIAAGVGVSPEWRRLARCTPHDVIDIVVALRLSEDAKERLDSTLTAVSYPDSERYGEHLTQAQMTELVAPAPAAVAAVLGWLADGGAAAEVIGHGDVIRASLSATDAEALLDTEFWRFSHVERTDVVVTRSFGSLYTVPAAIAEHVALIDGLIRFPNLRGHRVQHNAPGAGATAAASSCLSTDCSSNCCQKVTPAVLKKRYSVPDAVSGNANASRVSVAEFEGQGWDQKDLDLFSAGCHLPNVTVDVQAGAPSENSVCAVPILGQAACQESLLDIEYIRAVSPPLPLTDVYLGGYSLLNWTATMGAMSDATIPWVASVSYGNDEVQQTSVAYMESVNAAMQQLGARGVTVLFASGDQGPCGRSGCSDVYHPDFPAASPYVTAVGGTDFAAAGVIGDEKAWVDGGGGFSNTFAAPQYQTAAIAAYVKTAGAAMPPQAKWNATGRAYPDVSALAGEQNPYCMSVGSLMGISVAGTSAATPVVAAMIGRLNAVRLASGGKPLGFANPWLYSKAAPGGGFHDVTQGTITGGGSDGFPAVKGWDAATGWGTPVYSALEKAL